VKKTTQRKECVECARKLEYDLKERIKELECLYNISSQIESGKNFGQILENTAANLVKGFQYPEIACAAVVLTGVAGLWAAGQWSGEGLMATVSAGVRQHLELSLLLYQQMGLSQEQLDFLENSLDVIQRVLVGVMPAVVIGSTVMVAWVCLLTSRRLLQRQGLPFPDYGPLNRWKAPEPLVWAVIGSGVLLMLPGTGANLLGLNGLIVFMAVYFLQGLAIVAYFFQKKQIPRFARAVLYGLIAVQQVVMLAVIGIGFFDTWFNFRKLDKPLAPG